MPTWTEEEYAAYLAGRGKSSKASAVPGKSKYHATRTWRDGISFDSMKEADYYEECKLRLRAGELDGFFYHGKMVCTAGTDKEHRATLYEPDFIMLLPDGTYRIIDTTGMETEGFRLKRKALREKYPKVKIEIV